MSKANITDQTNPEQCRHLGSEILSMVQCLKDFHEAFDCVHNNSPTIVDDATALLRVKLLVSESSETAEAMANRDMVEILDGLVDVLYVTVGAAVSYGLGDILMDAFTVVHKNNMTKCGPDGKAIKDGSGKVIKPKGYVPVDLQTLLFRKYPPMPATVQKPSKEECDSCADTECSKQPLPQRICTGYVSMGGVDKSSCESCAVTDCGVTREDGVTCLLFKDNRNYPLQVSSSTAPTQQYSSDGRTPRCDNCVICLQLGGCQRSLTMNENSCCSNHKFL